MQINIFRSDTAYSILYKLLLQVLLTPSVVFIDSIIIDN